MERKVFSKLSLITTVLLSLGPTIAFADSGHGYITNTNPNVIKVKSNGHDYIQLDYLGNFSIAGKLQFDTGVSGRIKSWKAEPEIVNAYGIAAQIPGTSSYKKTKSYSIGHRPKSIAEALVFSLPSNMIKNAAIGMCNLRANELRGQGLSNHQIFSQHREALFRISLKATVVSNGAGSGNQLWGAQQGYDFKVQCRKWQGSPITPDSNDFTSSLDVNQTSGHTKEIISEGGGCETGQTNRGMRRASRAQNLMRCKTKAPGNMAPNPKRGKVRIPLGGQNKLSN